MIKNQLYPYIEEYINSFLYGFTKEQLDVGIMKGEIKFENLNLRPDGVNEVLDKDNIPFWLKAGLISKISFGCSLMNFIGEKPIEANFEGVNIILTPSYKWIIQNMDNYLFEDLKEMKMEYSSLDNNSVNIFGKKINVLDNSIFRREKLEEFFKDKSKVSTFLNKILLDCFKFYYYKNFAFVLKLKNIHIRFEDDQLINYFGSVAFGFKIDSFDLTLSSEGSMKKNNFKINKLDFYWENNANILIPSNILYDAIKNGSLNDSYYKNLSKIKFQNFVYKSDTKFILHNFNCLCNFGTKALNQGKIDIFAKKENNYKFYIQFASNEIKINFFPDLVIIHNNFNKFMKDFTIISQAQEFKPMKKPYSIKNQNFLSIISQINKNKNSKLAKKFPYKRKMLVRDWLFYFYWCYKCKSSIYTFNSNPLRAEFSRFINLCYKNDIEKIDSIEENKNEDKKGENKEITWSKENPNPDKINLTLNIDIKIKGISLNLYSFIYNRNKNTNNLNNTEYISLKITNPDIKLILNQEKFEFILNIKTILLGPNKLKAGEKIIIENNLLKKQETNISTSESSHRQRNKINNNILTNYLTANDMDSNTGITGFMKKYNPNYTQQLKVIDKAMEKIYTQQSHNSSKAEISMEAIEEKNKANNDNHNYKTNREKNYTSFSKNIIEKYEASPSLQKMELNRQKNEFNISQAINHYNNTKSQSKSNHLNYSNTNKDNNINNIPKPHTARNQSNKIITTGKILPLNLLEINFNNSSDLENTNNNSPCFSFKYIKNNSNIGVDILKIFFGIIRINLFSDYIIKCANILNDYNINSSEIKKEKNKLFFWENDLKLEKNVYSMKKYILQKIEQMPNVKNNIHFKNYINYLKNEIEKGKLIYQSDSSELNYIFTYFSKGIDINFDYNNLEFIYYSHKNNKYCGKAIIPNPQFNFKINHSNISLKLYDFEMDFTDLENANILFKTMHNVFEEKFKYSKILIEPCLLQIRSDIEQKYKKEEIEEDLSSEKNINKNNELSNNLDKILNNNVRPSQNINTNNNLKPKINANKTIEENIKKSKNTEKEKEKEKQIMNITERTEKELILNNPKENKEMNENKLLNLNKERVELESDNHYNIIIPKENKIIPHEVIETDINQKKKKTHKKIVNREKKKSNSNLKSKTIDTTKKNQNFNTSNNLNNSSMKEEEKENKTIGLSKKSSKNKLDVEKKGKVNIKSSRVLIPTKKKIAHNVKKVPLKNISKKPSKINKNDNSQNKTDNNNI